MHESYDVKDVQDAMEVLKNLLRSSEISRDKNPILFGAFRNNPVVKDLFFNIIEPTFEVRILDTPAGIFMVPDLENSFLGYSNEELRGLLHLERNQQLYMVYFIILVMLTEFFGENSLNDTVIEYITVEDLENSVSRRLENLEVKPAEELKNLRDSEAFNFSDVVKFWKELERYEDLKRPRASYKNRYSFVLRAIDFLQKEGLVVLEADRNIYITSRTQFIVRRYFSDDRIRKRMLTIAEGKSE